MHLPAARKQRTRRDLTAFKTLLATPATEAFALPAAADLLVRIPADMDEGTALGTIGQRSFISKEYFAGEEGERYRTAGLQRLGRFERGLQVDLAPGVDLVIDVGLGNYKSICSIPSEG